MTPEQVATAAAHDSHLAGAAPADPAAISLEQVERDLRRVDRRDRWLWGTSFVVLVLLAVGLHILNKGSDVQIMGEVVLEKERATAVDSLIALIFIFALFAIHQYTLLRRLRSSLLAQHEAMQRLQLQATLLRELTTQDPLTELLNRRFWGYRLPEEMDRALRYKHATAVVMLDVNDLKIINDTYGHSAGDAALTAFARMLKRSIRSCDYAARLGGDEFGLILTECPESMVARVLDRLKPVDVEVEDKKFEVGFSIGVTMVQEGDTPDKVCARADMALYRNKASRKAPVTPPKTAQRFHAASNS